MDSRFPDRSATRLHNVVARHLTQRSTKKAEEIASDVLQARLLQPKLDKWCGRRDLNPHGLRRHPLKMVCLPIPPLPRLVVLARRATLFYFDFCGVPLVVPWPAGACC